MTKVPLSPVPAVKLEALELLPLSIRPPAVPPTVTPPVKVLAPLSCRMPLPVLVMEDAEAPSWTIAEMFRVATSGAMPTVVSCRRTGATLMALAPAGSLTVPETVATLAGLLDVAVIGVLLVSVSTPPEATVGLALPPRFENVRLLSVFAPTKVRVPEPLIVMLAAGLICPAFVFIVTATWVSRIPIESVRSPGMT